MRSFGVEEEFLLVTETGDDLVARGSEVVDDATRHDEGNGGIEVELKTTQAEIGSEPHESAGEIEQDLRALRARLANSAKRHGARLVALGTDPNKGRSATTAKQRYEEMTAEFGTVGRQQLTCGQHVHVSIESRLEGIRVLDALQAWLPVLRAMTANSPFWQGEDTGYASFRTILWNQWPTAGPTEPFGDEQSYDARVAELIESGAAMDDGMIYFDARLSAKFPTVEIRVADVSTDVDTAVLIGVLCRALVERAASVTSPVLSPALVRASIWRAARYGLSERLIEPTSGKLGDASDVVASLIDFAASTGSDLELVQHGVDRLFADGTGAERQRAVFRAQQSLNAVVVDAADRTLA